MFSFYYRRAQYLVPPMILLRVSFFGSPKSFPSRTSQRLQPRPPFFSSSPLLFQYEQALSNYSDREIFSHIVRGDEGNTFLTERVLVLLGSVLFCYFHFLC